MAMGQAMMDAIKKGSAISGSEAAAPAAGGAVAAGTEAKFCLNCGKSIPKVSKFCPNCGQAQP
jgi:membrane protease subunit (stomatin/prohibitin family)